MANYYYNGVELPELPKWDKTTYPYAVITSGLALSTSKRYSRLIVSSSPLAVGNASAFATHSLVGTADGNGTIYTIDPTQNQTDWTYNEETEFTSGDTVSLIDMTMFLQDGDVLWSNYDVFNYEQDTIYLPASYPIDAETGEEIHDYEIGGVPTLTARDLYRKINDKPTKLTLYKKVGGELVTLDEYTEEVKT